MILSVHPTRRFAPQRIAGGTPVCSTPNRLLGKRSLALVAADPPRCPASGNPSETAFEEITMPPVSHGWVSPKRTY